MCYICSDSSTNRSNIIFNSYLHHFSSYLIMLVSKLNLWKFQESIRYKSLCTQNCQVEIPSVTCCSWHARVSIYPVEDSGTVYCALSGEVDQYLHTLIVTLCGDGKRIFGLYLGSQKKIATSLQWGRWHHYWVSGYKLKTCLFFYYIFFISITAMMINQKSPIMH